MIGLTIIIKHFEQIIIYLWLSIKIGREPCCNSKTILAEYTCIKKVGNTLNFWQNFKHFLVSHKKRSVIIQLHSQCIRIEIFYQLKYCALSYIPDLGLKWKSILLSACYKETANDPIT